MRASSVLLIAACVTVAACGKAEKRNSNRVAGLIHDHCTGAALDFRQQVDLYKAGDPTAFTLSFEWSAVAREMLWDLRLCAGAREQTDAMAAEVQEFKSLISGTHPTTHRGDAETTARLMRMAAILEAINTRPIE